MSNRVGQICICHICGNEVEFIKDSGAPIVCCGENMTLKKEGHKE